MSEQDSKKGAKEFQGFPKIARLSRNCVITEKLDGTNAQVMLDLVEDQGEYERVNGVPLLYTYTPDGIFVAVWAGSRTKWIQPGKSTDNYGFANWVFQHGTELAKLGPGQHFGEWWGQGIQRGYGLKEKRFSLFNTHRWKEPETRPGCVGVVPVLYEGEFSTEIVGTQIEQLRMLGSVASPGFMQPEGVVIYHEASKQLFKKTLEKDEAPKGQRE